MVENQVLRQIAQFRADFRTAIEGHDHAWVFNTDQSGFHPEHLSGRTLEIKGTQKVFSTIRSKHSATHSYTVQFLISADGELKRPVFIILQETGGVFGERVANTMFRHDEVRVLPSKSGKITKEILRYWFRDIYFPNSGNDSIFLLDALSTYRDRAEIDAEKPPDQNYQVITIPGGLTSTTQPLDVFFNRQYKTFFKSLSMHIHTYREEIKLHMRDTILKLHVLTHNQFRSPRLKDFIRYAWIKAGFIDRNVDADNDDIWFFSPKDYCFVEDELIINICSSCNVQPCFIRCAWCKQHLCFTHFYGENNYLHYCQQFMQ